MMYSLIPSGMHNLLSHSLGFLRDHLQDASNLSRMFPRHRVLREYRPQIL